MNKKIVVTSALYSISGPPRTGRTSTFERARLLFEKYYPNLPIVFLPDVFNGRPHPLERPIQERGYHAVSRLLRNWGKLNESFLAVRKELSAGNVVIVDGCGLDVYLDAVACKDCQEQKDEAFRLHCTLVDFRVLEQDIPYPTYFLRSEHNDAAADMKTFNASLETEKDRYFDGTNQKPPVYLNGANVGERAKEVVSYILQRTLSQQAETTTA